MASIEHVWYEIRLRIEAGRQTNTLAELEQTLVFEWNLSGLLSDTC